MTEAAEAKWPAMEKKFKPIEDFDPSDPAAFKGKIIRIETDNLMGYRFKPGDFPVCEYVAARTLALPFYGALTGAQVDQVCTKLEQIIEKTLVTKRR